MPGYELIGDEERDAILEWFGASNGVLFAHGFDDRRKGVFKVREFERAVAARLRCAHGQAVSSGSAALLVALRALGVRPGDEVITQSFTFVATLEAIIEAGAVPVVAEVDDSLTLDPDALAERITSRTKVVIPVHMAGAAADMERILAVCAERDVAVLEDAAQAFGGTYRGRALGTLGAAGTFSFDFAKNLTTGEGGMVVTDDQELFLRARALHDHGHEYDATRPRGRDTRSRPGFNYRMTELQAVIGLVQLGKLDRILAAQRANKAALKEALAALGLEFRRLHDEAGDVADHLIFFLESEEAAADAVAALAERGLGTKNLPDALDWHFAGTWQHMREHLPNLERSGCACRGDDAACVCGDLVRRAVSLPVNVFADEGRVEAVVEAVRRSAAARAR